MQREQKLWPQGSIMGVLIASLHSRHSSAGLSSLNSSSTTRLTASVLFSMALDSSKCEDLASQLSFAANLILFCRFILGLFTTTL